MAPSEEHVDELVVSTLATYQYSLEKAWALRDALRAGGLCDPGAVAKPDVTDIGNSLKAAGYNRGGITYITAPRLLSLMEAVQAGALDSLPPNLELGDRDSFSETLSAVKGFGPKAAQLAWELMSPVSSEEHKE